jgi:hypothetical protein
MSLSDLAALGSFVSGVAVLISLVFLYFQLRQINAQVVQAERNQQSTIRDSRTTRMVDFLMQTTDASLADAVMKGLGAHADMTDTQINQFRQYTLARLYNAEAAFNDYRLGLLDETAFVSIDRGLRSSLSGPGARAMYTRYRRIFGDDFAAYIDNIVTSTPVALPVDANAIFRSDVAAEIAKTNS